MMSLHDSRSILAKLPPIAFVDNSTDQRPWPTIPEPVILVRRGAPGFFPLFTRLTAAELNRRNGVTRAQVVAMLVGSSDGWEAPGVDPDLYDEQGRVKYAH